ncbi:hypothetical protein GRAN_0092 [Granulicella sibirica]|uniref:Uncharacterized protein n=1 Tax=Granulicella sibirica TaxID=2479048 RepID=A0A4Q0T1U8_9BACT|nr:hypothetical protein GRAN_0092 [Granulicella sibirica]
MCWRRSRNQAVDALREIGDNLRDLALTFAVKRLADQPVAVDGSKERRLRQTAWVGVGQGLAPRLWKLGKFR